MKAQASVLGAGVRGDGMAGWKKRFLIAVLAGAALLSMVFFLTKTDYVAEAELPYYCMYQWEDEIEVTVRRQDGFLVQRVVCKTDRAAENTVKIAYRSMVYWGYREQAPFPSSYPYGEEEPKMYQATKDNYLRAKRLNMFGRDYWVVILIFDEEGALLWQGSYHP